MMNFYTTNLELIAILGVELFFPLSGFVLANQLKKLETNTNFTSTFLFRRWIRTLPPYLVALICAGIMFDTGNLINFIKFATYTQNIIADNPSPNFFSVAWSLSVEEWFYISIPLLLIFTSKLFQSLSDKLILICLFVIMVGILTKAVHIPTPEQWGEEIRRSVVFRIDSICYGVLAFLWRNKINKKIFSIIFILFFSFMIYLFREPDYLLENQLIQLLFLPACSFSFAVSLAYLSKFKINNKLSAIGKFLANISYSMYLFHLIFMAIFQKFILEIQFSFLMYILSLMLFSTVFYYYFEKPINDLRPNY